MSLDVVFAYVVGVLAGLAVIGALAFALVWEWCAIRRTLAGHRHRAPNGFWRERGAMPLVIPTESEPIREGTRRVLAGQSVRGLALDWRDRARHGQRRP
jgi:formylglycine-generating enzyme required for sulfatase activity